MAPSRRTWFDERGLTFAAPAGAPAEAPPRQLDLFAGAMHYWRTPAAHWKRCLASLRGLGLTAVESYVPWRIHEPTSGAFAWRGERDLRHFVELAGEQGLAVILRVGPAANAELTGFGLPDDVLADPELSARTSHGSLAWLPAPPRAFPIPSYASTKLFARVDRWYQAIAEQVAALAAPAGPIAALGVDNEAQLFFRRGAYDLDYHPDAVTLWTSLHPQWPEPPRAWSPDDAPRCLAWVRFKRTLLATALRRFSASLSACGFSGLARLHNLQLDTPSPATLASALSDEVPSSASPSPAAASASLATSSSTDVPRSASPPPDAHSASRSERPAPGHSSHSSLVAFDSHGPFDLPTLRRSALRSLTSQPLPFVLECGLGDVPWLPPAGGTPADQHRALTLLSAGARALSFYMTVERERWAGGLLSPDGTPTPDAAWVSALLSSLRALDWPSLRRLPPVAIVTSSLDADLATAASLLDPITPAALPLFNLPLASLSALPSTTHLWLRAVELALERAGIPYDVVDDSTPPDALASYRALIAPFTTHIPAPLLATLRDLAESRRTIVVLGPTPPTLDESNSPLPPHPLRRTGKMHPGSLTDLEGLSADLTSLAGPPPTWRCPTDSCTLSLFFRAATPVALFLSNDGPATAAHLSTTDSATALLDALTSERIPLPLTSPIPLSASSIRFFLIERP